jgi:RNA polymerase sigma factor (sigma-70 family)
MAGRILGGLLRHVRQVAQQRAETPTDAELLHRFASLRDEAAFATLVGRHGALVWVACRAVLGHEQDAEDAFQATFLVLAQQCHAVRKETSLGSWLYGVARRVALKARRTATRRRLREEKQVASAPEGPVAAAALRELQVILQEEVDRLPAKQRAPFVLCCLEGLGRVEAAQALGWKEGTLSARLTQARRALEQRLQRRGVTLAAACAAYALCAGTASAAVPAQLTASTNKAALLLAAGEASGLVSARAVVLAEGVIKSMFLTKLKMWTALLLALAFLATGIGLAVQARARPEPLQVGRGDSPKPAEDRPGGVKPARAPDLVRALRQHQEWIHKVKSLSLHFEGKLADGRGKEFTETVVTAFDGKRLRHSFGRKELAEQLNIWDGKRAITWFKEKGYPARYIFSRDLPHSADMMSGSLPWLEGQPHTFWWTQALPDADREKLARELEGKPEDYVITGRKVYRGVPCHVLQKKGWQMVRLYVGERTGLLHGRMEGALLGNPEADRQAVKAAAAQGKKVKDFMDFVEWAESLEKKKTDQLMLGVMEAAYPSDLPQRESWQLDYKEVQPGKWLPMTQGYASCKGTHTRPVTEFRSELKVVAVKMDETLPADLFTPPEMKEGALIEDQTTDPPLSYKHKKDRTRAEWEALRAEARKVQAEDRKAKARRDELIGKPGLALPKEGWINGPARSLEDLRGKPVFLLFWAEWCGPCHGQLPRLRQAEGKLFHVIGVHTPGSQQADIEKALKEAKAGAPVCIDPVQPGGPKSWGSLLHGYRLRGLPSAVLLDADGKIVALGHPGEVWKRMGDLLKPGRGKSP